ncbi:hypothetical protein DGG96_07510 [Legionella qingyii]|uniref:Bile acid beta-glucosidase n=1 Tax=Legionella qingyii TaxID=2184757 RepID=A0A317U719_9GAMM|nr:hypothetical protein [Legionella qingyii]PWY56180.1 hypothetical protein DGG96_07510 [Legionella qingyii]RUR22208.1 hypothetical protein ELY20_09885 [Legionella qingyii]RUR25800.1 hypothetical protein ELY16_09115 [Legionella qingyii]
MKFENSTFEERFNDYWNSNVVTLDIAIRSCSLGLNLFEIRSSALQLIETYQRHILNILSNLTRQIYLFDDKEYVQKYIKNTVDQAIEDLSFYKNIFPEYKEIPAEFLTALINASSSESENIASNSFF